MIKRIAAIAAAAAMCITCGINVFAASPSSVTISGSPGKVPVSFTYDTKSDAIVKSVKHLLPDIPKTANQGEKKQSLAIHSISTENKPVEFSLRLSKEQVKTASPSPQATSKAKAKAKETDEPESESIFDYYAITITDSSGASIYDYRRAGDTSPSAKYKDIPLKTLNTKVPVEKETYTIVVATNSAMSKRAAEAEKLDWQIVINSEEAAVTPSETPSASYDPGSTPQATAAQATPDAVIDVPSGIYTPLPTQSVFEETPPPEAISAPEETSAPEVTSAPTSKPVPTPYNGKRVLDTGLYTVGNEIEEGRYEITGNSTVKVYTAQGDLKTNIILTTDKNSREGVESYVLTLKNGELIDVSAPTTFTEYVPSRTTPKPTTKASSTAKPATNNGSSQSSLSSSRVTPTPKATVKPTATPKASASKSNPDTGDNAPVALAVSAIAAAIAAIAVLEIFKRRKNR